ncbi:MAG: hypothetical protein AB4042_01830 [Leptolyngbyaceae cyanobacterium]
MAIAHLYNPAIALMDNGGDRSFTGLMMSWLWSSWERAIAPQ